MLCLFPHVIGTESYTPEDIEAPADDAPQLLKNMWMSWQQLHVLTDDRALIENYHDSQGD